MFEGLVQWTIETFAPLGILGLFLLAVIESIFFPIPTDVLLIVLVAADPSLWLWLALVATVGSVLGAAIGYRIGLWGEQAILERFFAKRHIERAHDLFQRYETLAIFIAGFTPVPYKVFAVAAGAFYVRFWPFIIVSLIARGLRFLLVAGAVAWFSTLPVIVNAITILVALIVVEAWLAYRLWMRR